MKIFDYYNNLRKKRIVAIAALALMALVLVTTPLTTHAGTGIYSTDDDGILYVGESMTLTHDITAGSYGDITSGPYFYFVMGGNKYPINVTREEFGLIVEYVSDNEIIVTNDGSVESFIVDFGICGKRSGTYSYSDKYTVKFEISSKTFAQAKMGSIFVDTATMVTTMLTFMQQFLTFMTSNPILLIPLIVFLVGVAIFFLARLIKD